MVLMLFPILLGKKDIASAAEWKLDPYLQKKLAEGAESLEVIVTFTGDGAPTAEQVNLLKKIGVEKGVTMQSLPIAGIVATKEQIAWLAENPQVRSIYFNRKLTYFNEDETVLTGVDKVRTDEAMRKDNGGLPLTGKGIGVVVNDSGIDATHKDLEWGKNVVQNVLGTVNLSSLSPGIFPITYIENVVNTDTNSGHGTHVAGTVGGTGAMSGGKYEGVAPGASLIGYGSGAALFILDGIGGFDYAITHQAQYNIRVITNSWGSSGDFDPTDPINIASKKAYDRGIVVLFAAGNEGPAENTMNSYAKAPWVIAVAAGDKDGKLADFSSRGTKGGGGTFTIDGQTWKWEDRPTVTAPGVDVISTRAIAPISTLGADKDIEMLAPAYLPYYTVMSGTSMATPHTAGIVALMLEANPKLSPAEVKDILQKTATNMPGYEPWEAGAGYVNAYAAVDQALHPDRTYGRTVNMYRSFFSRVNVSIAKTAFTVDYNPVSLASEQPYWFEVQPGLASLVASIDAKGLLEQTGNPINLVLVGPDGAEYSSGVNIVFPLYTNRTVTVTSPAPGRWKVLIRGLRGSERNPTGGIAFPEKVNGTIAMMKVEGYEGLKDIAGHPAASAIQIGVAERLFDGYADGTFQPDRLLKRAELAKYLVMGAEIRQSLPPMVTAKDVVTADQPFVEAVLAKGAAFRDKKQIGDGVMTVKTDGRFAPNDSVSRAELAYSLVQSLGLQKEAANFQGDLTVLYKGERIKIEDAEKIPDRLKGYVQLALDLNILNAKFSVSQGPYDLQPTVHAYFSPNEAVARGDFAVAMTRYFHAFFALNN
ncbi:peptidase S8 [Geobacillus sp. MMMUD3]|nr:peptidase S8 [Geobacillus sp. MMMUD3]